MSILVGFTNKFALKKAYMGLLLMCLALASPALLSQPQVMSPSQKMQVLFAQSQRFFDIYEAELGPIKQCDEVFTNGIKNCYQVLKNDGNAPFILLPRLSATIEQPKGVVVLFHGLSDSPFFMSSIGEFLRTKGYVVIAPLTPGHGKLDADADMQDERLKTRWLDHTNSVMAFAQEMATPQRLPVVVGGFSTGGAFATYYTLNNPDKTAALLLFSGALQLADSAESMAKVWGMKSLAKLLDGVYETQGGHPFKYPSVASYSGLVLMDILHDIRDLLSNKLIEKPIFAAHSLADRVTLFSGVEALTQQVKGKHTLFKIDESYDLCHADLPMSAVQIINLSFDKTKINENERCSVPQANPLHQQMLMMLEIFLSNTLAQTTNV